MRGTRITFGAILLFTITAGAGQVGVTASAAAPATPAASHGGAATRACSLLTKEDAAEALGEAAHGPTGHERGDTSNCEYTGSGINRINLNLMRMPTDQAQMYAGLCAQKTKEGLNGLGSVTCWYNEKHEELQVLKGAQFFSIQLRRHGDPTESIKRVAKRVYDKLP